MIYEYIRISTTHQHRENQKFEISNYAKVNGIKIHKWVEETISSTKDLEARQLGNVLHKLKSGDILIATELSRLGRNLLQVMSILHHCMYRNCQVWTIKENYKLGADIQSKVLAFAFGLSAEIERQLISQRTKESLARVKAEGKRLGRPKGKNYSRLAGKEEKIAMLLRCGITKAEISRTFGIHWTTVSRYIREKMKDYDIHPIRKRIVKARGLNLLRR